MSRRSIIAYFVKLGCAPVAWKTKKRDITSHSSAKAEYRAMANATSETIRI